MRFDSTDPASHNCWQRLIGIVSACALTGVSSADWQGRLVDWLLWMHFDMCGGDDGAVFVY